MKKVLVLMLIAVFMVAFAQAGDENHPMTMKGDRALLFTISGLGVFGIHGNQAGYSPLDVYMSSGAMEDLEDIDIGGFDDRATLAHGLGFLYYFGDNTALRMGLCYQSATVKQEYNEDDFGFDGEMSVSLSTMSIAPGLQYHLVNTNALTIYTGAQFFYASSSMSMKAEEDGEEEEVSLNMGGFGFGGLIGAQFYPFKNVSFGAEYQLGYASLSSTMKYEGEDDDEEIDGPSFTAMGIASWGVTLGFHF